MNQIQRGPGGPVLVLAADMKVMADILTLGLECFRCRKKEKIHYACHRSSVFMYWFLCYFMYFMYC